ncbi:hypothetical protein V490_04998 [Pseudogymnoascus sp. VKM F-3557]|nr:hypothetical protein V490_04998 [Pseudogymnoascus sp. VKM F-3557]
MRDQDGPDGYYRSRRYRQPAHRRRNRQLLNRTESYSHIQVVAHPDANSRQEPQSPFVQNKSLQDEVYNTGEYGQPAKTDAPTIASNNCLAPISFAQVAASMSGTGQSVNENSRQITYGGGEDTVITMDQAPLAEAGPRRCTLKAKKKPKKWSPFDLGGPEGEVDTDDNGGAIPKGDSSVPELPTTVLSVQDTSTPTAESQQHTNQSQELSPTKSIISKELHDSLFGNTNYNTATDIAFSAAFPQLRSTPAKSSQERSIIHKEDPEDTKLRLEHIMARIDDAFDVEEWDPDLPAGNSSNSPEQLTAEPLKVTYTTVGSVAKTDVVPTFTPPIRIQREGSGRRLSVVPMPRGPDNYYNYNRNQLPGNNSSLNYGAPTNTKNPRYTQQQYAPPSSINFTALEKYKLTDLEKEVLLNSVNSAAEGAVSKEHSPQTTSTPDVSLNSATSGNFSIQKILQEETSGPSTHLAGSSTFAGLNKMQTLQRLAQFDNPAQEFAKSRLKELKAAKQQFPEGDAPGANSASKVHSFDHGNNTGVLQFGDTGSDPCKNSVISYGSQFPGQENGNPLQPGYSSFSREYSMNGYGSKTPAAPPGYPQPLTAGPPRQGQNSVAFNRLAWTSEYSQLADNTQQSQPPQVDKQYSPWNNTQGNLNQQTPQAEKQYTPWNSSQGNFNQQAPQAEKQYSPWNSTQGDFNQQALQAEKQYSPWNSTLGNFNQQAPQAEQQYSPWNNTQGNFNQQPRPFSSLGPEHNKIRDTLSLEEMAKYYPNGFGPNFQYDGEHKELDNDTKLSNLGLSDESLEAKQKRKAEKLDEWFYGSLSRLNMTITDHIEELENRDKGIVPSAPRVNLANRETLSVQEIREKTDAECAAPLIDNLFGTLLAYSDNVMQPTNRRAMSRFVQSPAWALDTSEEGKKSFFGDKWEAPPKKLGNDSRYQRSKLSETWD